MTTFGEQAIALLDHSRSTRRCWPGPRSAPTRRWRRRSWPRSACAARSPRCRCPTTRSWGSRSPMGRCWWRSRSGARLLARAARLVPPGTGPWLADVALDAIRQDPGPSGAVLQGLLFGRVAPAKAMRRTLRAPTLVIGHPRDPVHPFGDSDALVSELPDARLVRADSLLELRLSPERLTAEIVAFLDDCWKPRGRGGASKSKRVA